MNNIKRDFIARKMFLKFSVLFIFFKGYFCRLFRLMDPQTGYFFGVHNNIIRLVPMQNSEVFEDTRSTKRHGVVNVILSNTYENTWDFDMGNRRLISYPLHDGSNQRYQVVHLARDLVIIKSEINLNRCLTHKQNTNIFRLLPCRFREGFPKQKFLITDPNGTWRGTTLRGYDLNDPDNLVEWGVCPTCNPGGFGSEEQGITADIAKQSIHDSIYNASAWNGQPNMFI